MRLCGDHYRILRQEKSRRGPGAMDHTCNPTYLGGIDWEVYGLKPVRGKERVTRPHCNK
jgi:hypothetical protein